MYGEVRFVRIRIEGSVFGLVEEGPSSLFLPCTCNTLNFVSLYMGRNSSS